jgi:hypothetical protein
LVPAGRPRQLMPQVLGAEHMVFYLFRARGGVNGIPMPSSAQYRLWIQPKWQRLAGNSGRLETQTQQVVPTEVSASAPSR